MLEVIKGLDTMGVILLLWFAVTIIFFIFVLVTPTPRCKKCKSMVNKLFLDKNNVCLECKING